MLKNLNSKKPELLEATITLSDLLCEQERYKEALTLVTEALKYHPNNYDLYYSMGIRKKQIFTRPKFLSIYLVLIILIDFESAQM